MELAWLLSLGLKVVVLPPLALLLGLLLYVSFFYPQWQTPMGPFKMVGVRTHRVPKSVRFKVFYPSGTTIANDSCYQKPTLYTDWRSFEGMSLYTTVPKWLFWFVNLGGCTLPCFVNAPSSKISEHSELIRHLPCVIFSHGLIGNWDIYSQLCIHLASFGLVVIAVDFDDGSASFTISGSNLPMLYEKPFVMDEDTGEKRMLGMDASRDECQRFRGPQLRHRVRRTEELMDYIFNEHCHHSKNNGSRKSSFSEIVKMMDLKKVFLIGHSFGGCSHLLYLKHRLDEMEDEEDDESDEDGNESSKVHICGVVTYEPWLTPATDQQLNQPWHTPHLCIVGDRWTSGDLYKFARRMCESNSNPCHSDWNCFEFGYGIKHPSFSDVMFWCPDWFARMIGGPSFGDILPIPEQSSMIIGRTMDFIIDVLAKKEGCQSEALPMKMQYNRGYLRNCWAWPKERKERFSLSEEESNKKF